MTKAGKKKAAPGSTKAAKQSNKSIARKLLAIEPEYRFRVYLQLQAEMRKNKPVRGSPMVSGSFESGKRR